MLSSCLRVTFTTSCSQHRHINYNLVAVSRSPSFDLVHISWSRMEGLLVLCLLTSLSVAPFSAAVTAEATSGRARRAQHRRQAQTRRRARGELASYTMNASSTASLSDSSTRPAVGMCRATRNDPGHCESGLSGSWTTRSHGISDLEQCAARCRLCVG